MSPWTPEKVEALKLLWPQDLTLPEIGLHLGMSKGQVCGKAHRLQLPNRPNPIGLRGQHVYLQKVKEKRAATLKLKKLSVAPKGSDSSIPQNFRRTSRDEYAALGLSASPCQFPITDDRKAGYEFCQKRAVVGRSYCPDHCAVAYVKAKSGPKAVF